MNTTPTNNTRDAGYTLTELAITTLILGVALAGLTALVIRAGWGEYIAPASRSLSGASGIILLTALLMGQRRRNHATSADHTA